MKGKVLCALFLVLALSLSATLSAAQTPAEFKLGFKALADQIPDVVGTPAESEHFNILNGNSEQRTTKGLMVWRKADNWTAFTNGYMTWINGQTGVQTRLNSERFLWENTPVEAEARRPAPAAAATQIPPPPGAIAQIIGVTGVGVQAPAPAATAVPVPAAPVVSPPDNSKEACLACHGPFDKLISATANYIWPKGGKDNPHQNVPHGTQTLPDCTSCHTPHSVPPTAASLAAMGTAQPKLCLTCHPQGF